MFVAAQEHLAAADRGGGKTFLIEFILRDDVVGRAGLDHGHQARVG